jgi:hypothetical protein
MAKKTARPKSFKPKSTKPAKPRKSSGPRVWKGPFGNVTFGS